MNLNSDELKELAAGYALGALEPEDVRRFETLLNAGNREALQSYSDYSGAVLSLISEQPPVTPPAQIRDRLLERIDRAGRRKIADVIPLKPRYSGDSSAPWWNSFAGGAMAAGLAALVVGYSFVSAYRDRYRKLESSVSGLRKEMDELVADRDDLKATLEAQKVYAALVRSPSTQIVVLKGLEPGPQATGRMLWDAKAGGLFVANGLPPPPEGKTYQLWAIQGRSAPVPAGVFGVDAEGRCELNVNALPVTGTVDVFAVTLEPEGGLPAPSGPMYLAGKGGI